jgi:hypothetical protein
VALLVQMDRTTDSGARHATISAVTTFLGDVVARPMHSSPYWAEPALTAAVSGLIAFALWHAKRRLAARGAFAASAACFKEEGCYCGTRTTWSM